MKLYHFLSTKWALDDLRKKRLRVSKPDDLNDPLEFTYFYVRDPVNRLAMKYTVDEAAKLFGLLCFSRICRDPVMWSHYADRHRGVCLCFEVPDGDELWKVNYTESRNAHRFRYQRPRLTPLDAKKLYATKHISWAYEKEMRLFLSVENEIEREGDHWFCPFSDRLNPTEVIVGIRSEVTRQQIDDALGDMPWVRVCKARPMELKFGIERDPAPFI